MMKKDNNKSKKKSLNKGFSIIEVLISVGILSLLSAVMSTMISQQIATTNYINDILSRDSFQREVQLLLDNVDICSSSLTNFVINKSLPKNLNTIKNAKKLSSIKNAKGQVIYDVGKNSKFERLDVETIQVLNKTVLPSTNGIVDIIFHLKRQRKGGGPKTFKGVTIPVIVNVDAAYKVTSCGDIALSGIAALVNTPWNGTNMPRIRSRRQLPFGAPKDNYSGNINIGSYGIQIEVDGCYDVTMGARVILAPYTKNTMSPIQVSWFRKKKTGGNEKLGHLMSTGYSMHKATSYYHSKKRVWPFKKGDQVIAIVEQNKAEVGLMYASSAVTYISKACNAF